MDSDSDAYMSDNESVIGGSDLEFNSDNENDFIPAPKKTATKTKTVPTKIKIKNGKDSSKILSTNSNISNVAPIVNTSKPKSTKTVEEIYQKKTQLEHILLRPDTYSKLLKIYKLINNYVVSNCFF